jgi:hypothetical protein
MNTTATLERRVDTWPQRLSDWFDMPDLTAGSTVSAGSRTSSASRRPSPTARWW